MFLFGRPNDDTHPYEALAITPLLLLLVVARLPWLGLRACGAALRKFSEFVEARMPSCCEFT